MPSAVGRGRGTAWPGRGKDLLLPSQRHTAVLEIPIREFKKVTMYTWSVLDLQVSVFLSKYIVLLGIY